MIDVTSLPAEIQKKIQDFRSVRHVMDMKLQCVETKSVLTDHAVYRALERKDTFSPPDMVATCTRFVEQHKPMLDECISSKRTLKGVIKDYSNWMNIAFEFSPFGLMTKSSKHALRIVTLIRMNPDNFKRDQPWRQKEWYKVLSFAAVAFMCANSLELSTQANSFQFLNYVTSVIMVGI